ncbi:MAG: rRNA maturation RNase YbeY [bacterium]
MRLELFGTRDARLRAALGRVGRRVDERFALGRGTVSVVFVDDHGIRALNHDWLGRDRPTDVLSFRLDAAGLFPQGRSQPGRVPLLGEIYVSRERAREQAREQGVTVRAELCRLVLHGLLHLAGLTHAQMRPYEREWNR